MGDSDSDSDVDEDAAVTETEVVEEDEASDEAETAEETEASEEDAAAEGDESAEEAEETSGTAYLAGTVAVDYVNSMYRGMTEDETVVAPDPTIEGDVAVYEVSTGYYTLTVEASAETDEISYVKLEVFGWDENVKGFNLLGAAMRSLYLEGYSAADATDFLLDYFGGDANEKDVSGESESNLGCEGVIFKLSASENNLPILEIMPE